MHVVHLHFQRQAHIQTLSIALPSCKPLGLLTASTAPFPALTAVLPSSRSLLSSCHLCSLWNELKPLVWRYCPRCLEAISENRYILPVPWCLHCHQVHLLATTSPGAWKWPLATLFKIGTSCNFNSKYSAATSYSNRQDYTLSCLKLYYLTSGHQALQISSKDSQRKISLLPRSCS